MQGRRYRVLGYGAAQESGDRQASRVPHEDADSSALLHEDDAAVVMDDLDSSDPSIVQRGSDFVCKLSLDPELHPFLIGKEGRNRKRVESESGASLEVPRPAARAAAATATPEVVIRGPSRAAVGKAKLQVEMIVADALASSRLDYTHFVSVPLGAGLTTTLERFKQQAGRIPVHASCAPGCLHVRKQFILTLSVLSTFCLNRVQMSANSFVFARRHAACARLPIPLLAAASLPAKHNSNYYLLL